MIYNKRKYFPTLCVSCIFSFQIIGTQQLILFYAYVNLMTDSCNVKKKIKSELILCIYNLKFCEYTNVWNNRNYIAISERVREYGMLSLFYKFSFFLIYWHSNVLSFYSTTPLSQNILSIIVCQQCTVREDMQNI